MATKKKEAPKAKGKGGKNEVSEKEAKRKARLEKLKDRPAVQRTNSRQVDVIDGDNFTVQSFGYAIRKTGTLVTTVLLDKKGNPVSVSTNLIPGTKVKVKKNHGAIQPGLAGLGKRGASVDDDQDSDEDED